MFASGEVRNPTFAGKMITSDPTLNTSCVSLLVDWLDRLCEIIPKLALTMEATVRPLPSLGKYPWLARLDKKTA